MPFISPDDTRWIQVVLACPHDMYQLPGYSVLEAKMLQGSPLAWYSTDKSGNAVLIPLIERVIHNNDTIEKDLVSPYGYPGIVHDKSISKEQYSNSINEFHAEAAQKGYVSSFIRLHPIYNTCQISNQPGITQHIHGFTISINLDLSIADIRKTYSLNHRRNLTHLLQKGYQVSINEWGKLHDFVRIYTQTMERKKAKCRYFFNEEYLIGLKEILKDNLMLIMVQDDHGQQTAGGLFSIVSGLAQFHLGGTANDFMKHSPSKLMIDAAIEHCKSLGAHTLHFGGGFGSAHSDGLFRFKAGFGRERHTFSTLRFIHCPNTYNKLLKNVIENSSENSSTYFPEYRFLSEP